MGFHRGARHDGWDGGTIRKRTSEARNKIQQTDLTIIGTCVTSVARRLIPARHVRAAFIQQHIHGLTDEAIGSAS